MIEPQLDDKYIAIKADAFAGLMQALPQEYRRDVEAAIKSIALPANSFFVLRDGDVFGPAALFGYAHVIQSNLEISRLPDRPTPLTDEEAARLTDLADSITSLALSWQASTKKIPD